MSGTGFEETIAAAGLDLAPGPIDTLQLNVTKVCNQACRHCHVDASPSRTEQMSAETLDACLRLLERLPEIGVVDVTGGAPELNPGFRRLVRECRALGRRVMVRHNLTVTFDPHPQTGESLADVPDFFAENGVEVVCSLPYYQEYFTDRQRGSGVFARSIEGLRRLNELGYGREDSDLDLALVYNPAGAYLPPDQADLERDYREALRNDFGIVFDRLYAIANLPVHRFKDDLVRAGGYDAYMSKLVGAFNPAAAEGVMCRTMINVGWDGSVYDCDFNQMLEMRAEAPGPVTVFDFDADAWRRRRIRFAEHCFGCTAGAGSSCGGATT